MKRGAGAISAVTSWTKPHMRRDFDSKLTKIGEKTFSQILLLVFFLRRNCFKRISPPSVLHITLIFFFFGIVPHKIWAMSMNRREWCHEILPDSSLFITLFSSSVAYDITCSAKTPNQIRCRGMAMASHARCHDDNDDDETSDWDSFPMLLEVTKFHATGIPVRKLICASQQNKNRIKKFW